jgi:hypothetical protein
VGEGGVAPDYFLHRMQWWEVNRCLAGLHRRYHTIWENTRALQWFLACMFNDSKKHATPKSPQDLYKFGWEEDQTTATDITEQDKKDLQEMMDNFKWN